MRECTKECMRECTKECMTECTKECMRECTKECMRECTKECTRIAQCTWARSSAVIAFAAADSDENRLMVG
jgi:hypothetical protein